MQRRRIKVAVVTFENDYFARQYVAETALAWPLLIDTSRETYRGYGMLAAGWWDVWGPATWLAYARALGRGEKLQSSRGDVYQRGGDVLIDPHGIVRLHHVGRGPADRPSIASLLALVPPV